MFGRLAHLLRMGRFGPPTSGRRGLPLGAPMNDTEFRLFAIRVWNCADRIRRMKVDRLRAECEAVGLEFSCVHNASIDDNLAGWCYRNPPRLKIAKRIDRESKDFTENRLAERIVRRALGKTDR
jgi:hypothetical protein